VVEEEFRGQNQERGEFRNNR